MYMYLYIYISIKLLLSFLKVCIRLLMSLSHEVSPPHTAHLSLRLQNDLSMSWYYWLKLIDAIANLRTHCDFLLHILLNSCKM